MATRLNKNRRGDAHDAGIARTRILITTDFYAPHAGGVERYVEQLVSFFPDADITILTLALVEFSKAPAVETRGNVTIRRIPAFSLVGGARRIPKNSFASLREIPPHDIVITNTRFFSTTRLGRILARRWRVRHIHIEHGNRHAPHPNPFVQCTAWLYDQTFGRLALGSADRVVCISRAGLPFVKKLGAKRTQVIPNAIDPAPFMLTASSRAKTRVAFRRAHAIPSDATVILFVGRLIIAKGLQDLIDALAKQKDVVLVVIGAGSERGTLETHARERGVTARFLGEQPGTVIRDALAASDLFVNPSYAEGLPTSVLEALATGVPIVATDVGGTSELLPARCLVQPRNVPMLQDAILRALKKPMSFRASLPRGYALGDARRAWQHLIADAQQ